MTMTRFAGSVLSFAITALAVATTPAAAQTLGVKGGATFSTIKIAPVDVLGEPGYQPAVGALGGGFLTFRDTAKFSIEVAGQVAFRRVRFESETPSSSISTSITYLEVPVVIRYPLLRLAGKRIAAVGGGSLNIRLAAKETAPGLSRDVKDSFKSFEVAVVVGALVELSSRLNVEARYFLGSETFSESEFLKQFLDRANQQGWQFIAAYRLR